MTTSIALTAAGSITHRPNIMPLPGEDGAKPSMTAAGAIGRTGGPLAFTPLTAAGGPPITARSTDGGVSPTAREADLVHAHLRGNPHPVLSRGEINDIAAEIRAALTARESALDGRTLTVGDSKTDAAVDARTAAGEATPRREITPELVSRIIAKLDSSGDGRIHHTDAPFSDALFGAIDADADGSIDAAELHKALQAGYEEARRGDPALDPERFAMDLLFSPRPDDASVNAVISATAAVVKTAGAGASDVVDRPGSAALTPAVAKGDRAEKAPSLPRERLAEIARTIAARLDAAGHDRHPPLNLRQILAEIGLNRPDSAAVMNMLAGRYPAGLGLKLIG